jgi:hypothetical protein
LIGNALAYRACRQWSHVLAAKTSTHSTRDDVYATKLMCLRHGGANTLRRTKLRRAKRVIGIRQPILSVHRVHRMIAR